MMQPMVGILAGHKTIHAEKQRGNGDMASIGQNLKGRYNNQPTVGDCGRVRMREEVRLGWSVLGGVVSLFGAAIGMTKK